ncbi:MAG: phosphoribosylformylglycinamidine synthase subunit PurQ [Rickettsiales bacterium]|nr:phosphoribosylformylglycinamidine synthase subunit PurQ [Rickettsiales bacterium]
MKTGVIVFPGSNCDRDARSALSAFYAGAWGQSNDGSVIPLWHGEATLPKLDLIIVPGGFSYGDYLRSGAMAAHSPIMQAVKAHAAEGRYVLGICNGFQILTESGLLPGILMRNEKLAFICKTLHLRVENASSRFTRAYQQHQVLSVPVAHHDGNYFADNETLKSLEENDQILFRYSDAQGQLTPAANPNGSASHIAGIMNRQGNVAGMMPHPERVCDRLTGGIDGRALFQGLLAA